MKSILTSSLLAFLSLPLPGQLTVPKLGTVRYSDGSLHSVQGLPHNMIVSDLPLDPAAAASFSDKGGLVFRQGSICLLAPDLSVIAEFKTAETAPLLSMETDLTSALAWLPSTFTVLRWDGDKFIEIPLDPSELQGAVTNLQAISARQVRLLLVRPDGGVSGVTFSTRNGSLVTSEPLIGVRGYAFSQNFFVLYSDQKELVADNLRGYRRSLTLPATDLLMERMSNNWLHLYSPSLKQDWALHLTQADLELSILPAIASAKVTSTLAAARGAQ